MTLKILSREDYEQVSATFLKNVRLCKLLKWRICLKNVGLTLLF